ncbi:S49 family peptidase [Planctomycetes bacterium TBK1r]|uniref:Signal peptide peptidase SppA n=1 Tax=Stieleria magnilauensis TaxID=2527963 RepID=A0ABX5XZ95_9BACT|nr:Putative signal peptide peptidase SppA [Planctomycetes bacterium TBK1r]
MNLHPTTDMERPQQVATGNKETDTIPLWRCDSTLFLLLFVVLLSSGCGSKVFRHNGAVNMAGGFNMTGDMTVDGKMDMGELKTTVSLSPNSRVTPLTSVVVSGQATRNGKLAVLDVDDFLVDRNVGGIGSMGENPVALFHEKIDAIRNDKDVKAVVLRINSPGGGVTASDMMCHELARLKQDRQLPIIANIMTVGTGGAYYLANHCDAIIAHPTSIVGGIGVILNLYNLQDTMGQFNVLSMPIKSGEKIDAGTPERPIEADELVMLQRIADGFHQRLIDQIKSKRPKLAESQDQWSDGRVMSGSDAQSMGLVDGVGYIDTAIEWAKQQAGLKPDDRVVMYRRENDPAYTPLDVSPNQPVFSSLIPLRVPGLDRSTMPTFLYLWQSDPAMATLARP